MSSKVVNYQVRLAKNVERKIICTILRNIITSYPDNEYVYIGFGSYFFTDFILFQKELRIIKMISIENDVNVYDRATYNKPFECIQLKKGESTGVLRELQETLCSESKFIWLDYTGPFEDIKEKNIVLNDLNVLLDFVNDGDVYLTTINNRTIFCKNVDTKNKRLNGFYNSYKEYWGDAFGKTKEEIISELAKTVDETPEKFYRHIIKKHIDEFLIKNGSNLEFRQLVYLKYQDNSQMLTYGGFFCDKSEPAMSDINNVNGCEFIRSGGDIYDLQLPALTYREILALNKVLLENGTGKEISSENENLYLLKYIDIYKELEGMYPYFAEFI